MMTPVKENPNWFRHEAALVNTSQIDYKNFKQAQQQKEAQRNEIECVKSNINKLELKVDTINNSLEKILNIIQGVAK